MKKYLLNHSLPLILVIIAIAAAFSLPGRTTSSLNLQDLRAHNIRYCYCVPSPGSVCINEYTGTITLNYKVVCYSETSPTELLSMRR